MLALQAWLCDGSVKRGSLLNESDSSGRILLDVLLCTWTDDRRFDACTKAKELLLDSLNEVDEFTVDFGAWDAIEIPVNVVYKDFFQFSG